MAYVPKILAFAGSTRTGSFNKKLIKVGAAAALTALVWRQSRGVRSKHRRWLVRTGVFALGFTTVPLGRDDSGGLYPMGLYYLAFGRDWLEAATGATLVIGVVWMALLAGSLIVGWLVGAAMRGQGGSWSAHRTSSKR